MSICYALPRVAGRLFGFSEIAYRMPFNVCYGHRGVVYRASGDANDRSRYGLACRVHGFRRDRLQLLRRRRTAIRAWNLRYRRMHLFSGPLARYGRADAASVITALRGDAVAGAVGLPGVLSGVGDLHADSHGPLIGKARLGQHRKDLRADRAHSASRRIRGPELLRTAKAHVILPVPGVRIFVDNLSLWPGWCSSGDANGRLLSNRKR